MVPGWLPQEARAEVAEIAREVAALPAVLSQRTCERWTALPASDFLEAAREGAFVTSKVKRLVLAKTVDVIAWIESHRRVVASATDDTDSDFDLAAVGARRIGGSK